MLYVFFVYRSCVFLVLCFAFYCFPVFSRRMQKHKEQNNKKESKMEKVYNMKKMHQKRKSSKITMALQCSLFKHAPVEVAESLQEPNPAKKKHKLKK